MKLGSLRLRLLLGGVVFIASALALAAVGLTLLFERHVERWLDGMLTAHLDQVVAGLTVQPDGAVLMGTPPPDPRFDRPLSGLYWQVTAGPSGPVLRSRSLWDHEIALPAEARSDDLVRHYRVPGPDGSTLYLLQRRVDLASHSGGKTVRAGVGIDAAEVRAASWRFASALVPFLLLMGALLGGAAWAQVKIGLQPLKAVRSALAAVASGTRKRLGSGFPEELQPLAQEIDKLLAAREHEIEKARNRASELAHGLKTPLQVIAGDVERLRTKGEGAIAAEIEEVAGIMQGHVQRQLARARLASACERAVASVGPVIDKVVKVLQRTPQGRQLTWRVEAPAGLTVRIDGEDLAEALGNLVENAVRHASSNVAVTAGKTGDGIVTVTVADDGPGIPASLQEEVLRRGISLDRNGDGAGLGLAIVADIADAWGADLTMEDNGPGVRASLKLRQPN